MGSRNAELNDTPEVDFLQGKAEQVLPQLRVGKYQLVVLDPPRRGLHPEAANL